MLAVAILGEVSVENMSRDYLCPRGNLVINVFLGFLQVVVEEADKEVLKAHSPQVPIHLKY